MNTKPAKPAEKAQLNSTKETVISLLDATDVRSQKINVRVKDNPMETETYLQRRKRMYEETPLAVRQKFIDCIHEGMTIGEAQKEAGIEELDTACEIIDHNIVDYKYISKEAAK